MPAGLSNSGAALPPSDFAPLHVNRMVTGMWSNSNPLRDAATPLYVEKYQGGRQDRIKDGFNVEISPRLTLTRRKGLGVYNNQTFPAINRFYGWNTFSLTDEFVRVMADTAGTVYDATGPSTKNAIWQKSPGAGSTYFLGLGNTLYFTNGVDNKQLSNASGVVSNWGIDAPIETPSVSQMPRPNPYPSWQANTAYGINTAARTGMVILDDTTAVNTGPFAVFNVTGGGQVAIGCGQNLSYGAAVPLPSGFDNTRVAVWTTPGEGFMGSEISGVYRSTASGGFVTSAFQNRQGGVAGNATSNWIAIAWNAAADGTVSHTTSAGLTTIIFTTAAGAKLAFVVGTGANGSSIPVPGGFTLGQMQAITGMSSAANVNHAMQGVIKCDLNAGILEGQYSDQSNNLWNGDVSVCAIFWTAGQGVTTQGVTNGTAVIIPTGSGNTAALVFSTSLRNGGNFGMPGGYSSEKTFSTAAVTGWTRSGTNNGQGWSCSVSSQVLSTFYRDGSGNQWDAFASGFVIAYTSSGSSGNLQYFGGNGQVGPNAPVWNTNIGGTTADGSVVWTNLGPWQWQANHVYNLGDMVIGEVVNPPGMPNQIYVVTTPGVSGGTQPPWPGGPNLQQQDGSVVWTCAGHIQGWSDIGAGAYISAASAIVDTNGYLQYVTRTGKSGTAVPTWSTLEGATTVDNTMLWTNGGSYFAAATAQVQYGYAYKNNTTGDISNMSPASAAITVKQGNQVTVQGMGSGDPQVGTIVIYRTLQGGSTFFYLAEIPNPGATSWTYSDNSLDSGVNITIQAQVTGEGTPPPKGATCMEYHLGRIWVAAGNVVYGSSGPDAAASGSSGNAGFNLSFTAQSKVIRLWANSLGLLVYTVRDTYIIAPDDQTGMLFMRRWIENLPLLSYDAFTVLLTTPYMFTGNRIVATLDAGAGIVEASFPIADKVAQIDPRAAFCTFHVGPSGETALYLSDGRTQWYRMSPTSAPESGIIWHPAGIPEGGMSAMQSVEITPGAMALLIGPASSGPILMRDPSKNTDNGDPYSAEADFGSIVLALPGQLAGLAWMTLESSTTGTPAKLGVLLNEINGEFEDVPRTRQDPPNLPPSATVQSNRHSLLQSQRPVWCRHMQYSITWPSEDAANELLTSTIFGQTWQEQRSQQ